jgi:hypothetical protein
MVEIGQIRYATHGGLKLPLNTAGRDLAHKKCTPESKQFVHFRFFGKIYQPAVLDLGAEGVDVIALVAIQNIAGRHPCQKLAPAV